MPMPHRINPNSLVFKRDDAKLPFGLCPNRLGYFCDRETGERVASVWTGGNNVNVTTADLLVSRTRKLDHSRDSIYTIKLWACCNVLGEDR
jgi:hypothetical protein